MLWHILARGSNYNFTEEEGYKKRGGRVVFNRKSNFFRNELGLNVTRKWRLLKVKPIRLFRYSLQAAAAFVCLFFLFFFFPFRLSGASSVMINLSPYNEFGHSHWAQEYEPAAHQAEAALVCANHNSPIPFDIFV